MLAAPFRAYLVVPATSIVTLYALLAGRENSVRAWSPRHSVCIVSLAITAMFVIYVIGVGGDDTAAFPSFRLLAPVLRYSLGLGFASEREVTALPIRKQKSFAIGLVCLSMVSWFPDCVTMSAWLTQICCRFECSQVRSCLELEGESTKF